MTPTTTTLSVPYANGETAMFVGPRVLGDHPHNSSAIKFWCYDFEAERLTVLYHGGVNFYDYETVPASTLFAMLAADSLGSFIAREVKPNFPNPLSA